MKLEPGNLCDAWVRLTEAQKQQLSRDVLPMVIGEVSASQQYTTGRDIAQKIQTQIELALNRINPPGGDEPRRNIIEMPTALAPATLLAAVQEEIEVLSKEAEDKIVKRPATEFTSREEALHAMACTNFGTRNLQLTACLDPGTYHVLSVWQPWAWAIFHGKPIENRLWYTRYRGRLLIHAAKTTQDMERVSRLIGVSHKIQVPPIAELHFGKIIGQVELVDCKYSTTVSPCGWGVANAYHWHLRNPVLLDEPIPLRGQQQIFRYTVPHPL